MRRRDRGARSRLPLRKSLLGRFLGVFALVAACSVAATAWLASQTTSGALKQEQGQALADDARIYDALLGYAATHPRWDGVDQEVEELASRFGRRVAVTTHDRGPLADSAGSSGPQLPTRPSAVVDPLSVDSALSGAVSARDDAKASTDRIDARAVGPFRLPPAERRELRAKADRLVTCLHRRGQNAEVTDGPSGRPRVSQGTASTGFVESDDCSTASLDTPTATEAKALETLTKLANACLSRQDRPAITLNADLTWYDGPRRPAGPVAEPRRPTMPVPDAAPVPAPSEIDRSADEAIGSCVNTARREQLSSYVAQPALLFIGDPDRGSVPGFDLSAASTARIAGAAGLVLALTIGVSILTGRRLVRPLRALTGAAQQVIGNLVSNAVRHTPRGGRVDLRAYGENRTGGAGGGGGAADEGRDGARDGSVAEVVVEVADTGSGIASDDLPYMFDRFWRAERSRSRRTGGSGLGLAIVRKLTEAHGGSVTAASTEGVGSTFTLRLPADVREESGRSDRVAKL
ncbi:ATP-binding protein [Streptomyces sp. NPDC046182]|uniref:sensor histidine kinase n=1 Tax=Streptomyces sp. NPDC046182 TaxID=3154601 RepID=UPI0033C6B08A